MVSITKLIIVLLLVLPCLLADTADTADINSSKSKCSVSVTQSQSQADSTSKYTSYTGTITNTGSTAISSIIITASTTLKSLSGLVSSGGNSYTLSSNLPAGGGYSFTFSVKQTSSVTWSTTCTAAATQAPTTTTTTKAPKTTTTKPPKATTTTSTKAPKTTTTTAAPIKTTTTTAPSAPSTGATTKPSDSSDDTSSSTGSRKCSSGWWRPSPTTTWQWQLTGTVDTTLDVQMYDIDLFDSTTALIDKLHGAGRVVICYFSTQYENWRPDAAQFPASALGNNLDDWVGEKYVDIRSTAVRSIMTARLDLALSKGCDGVEPDNVDGYEATTGFPITAADQIDYNTFIANNAHSRGLSVGLKNDGDQASQLQPYFDWALNEQCNQYDECSALNTFINAGKAVFNCEYSGSSTSVCPKMVTAKFSTLFKALALDASVKATCCTYASGGCTSAAYSCITSKRSVADGEYVEEVISTVISTDEASATAKKMTNSAATVSASIIMMAGALTALSLLL